MKIENKVLLLLSSKEKMSQSLITEILKIVFDLDEKKVIKKLDDLEKVNAVKCEKGVYQITGNGLKRLPRPKGKVDYSLPYWLKNWTMLIFEIPEKEKSKRDKLRYRLKKFCFGMIQSSVWISPRELPKSIEEFINEHDLTEMVQVLKFTVSKEDNSELVANAWQVNKLNQEYREFVEDTKKRFTLVKDYNWNIKQVKKQVLKMLAEDTKLKYHQLLKKDPKLPKTILPSDWQGFRAHHIYQQLFKYL
jgi:phenylacetic acid degradation operon negative regulatory protein